MDQQQQLIVKLNSGTQQEEIITLQSQHFSVDPSGLEQDICLIGRIMLNFADVETRLGAEVARREARLKELDGELDLHFRATGVTTGERMTEGRIGSMVITHPERKKQRELLEESERNHNMMKW